MPNPVAEVVERLRKLDAMLDHILRVRPNDKLASIQRKVLAEAKAEIERLSGTIRADDERLKTAGARVGIIAGCDTADQMADEIERLSRERDAALAIERDPTSSERVCALMDAQYMAGAKAGWNASQSEDPEAAYAALGKSRDGYVKVLIETRSPAVSRERNTGVPEEVAKRIHDINEVLQSLWGAEDSNTIARALGSERLGKLLDAQNALYAMLSAAPQPPTVSTQGWQDISTAPEGRKVIVSVPNGKNRPPRTMMARFWPTGTLEVAEGYEGEDWAQEIDGEYYMPPGWYEDFEGEDAPAHNITPTHWMPLPAKPGGHLAPQPDLSTLTRERDQAREALAFYANPDNWNEDGQCFAGRVPVPMWASDDHGDTFIDGHLDLGATARSVLHHEKEEKA